MITQNALNTIQVYNDLLHNPLTVLSQYHLTVNILPAVNGATTRNVWIAAYGTDIGIDQSAGMAAAIPAGPPDCAVQRSMIVSPMRGHQLPVGAGIGGRHRAAEIFNAGAAAGANLWVTELQSGCTVLVLDWGASRYSLVHLQPSTDAQFNPLGQAIVQSSYTGLNAYKNLWLKQEMTTVVNNTGLGSPQRYIMIQSMFETYRGAVTQVIGIRQGTAFRFYRQRQNGNALRAEELDWSTWYSYVPYMSY
ncbi:hypothetical protein [Paraburkholderia sp. ZP32-5]|uniref:hypothetical protein n=1 Tax=Paraburkholderia sp. ZP32-5 TaxID=2883245 RepID=UPI001F43C3A6|nr:hypothetical protein [Paraburkholderia sp. ZP32-5]